MAKENLKRGIFITFEGPEGCGKTTHAGLIYAFLKSRSYDCVLTREPGGTKAGEEIRRMLLHEGGINISDITELFLFEAARAQIVGELIGPALRKGRIVLSDRFSDATFSYQGYAGGVDLEAISALDKVATGGLVPDLTILLDVDTITGLKRACKKGIDRMEKKKLAYHRKVRAGYLKLAKRYPGRIKIIKVRGSIEDTQKLVRLKVEEYIKERSSLRGRSPKQSRFKGIASSG